VDPRSSDEKLPKSLTSVKIKIDVVDLVVNPKTGLEIVQQAQKSGIKNVFIQPGAASDDIKRFCSSNNMEVVEGCVLTDMTEENSSKL